MTKLSILMTSLTLTMVATTAQAQPTIPKAFILDCQQRSISNAYVTFKAVIDKKGIPRCQGVNKTQKPYCPKGYVVQKRLCLKVKSRDTGQLKM